MMRINGQRVIVPEGLRHIPLLHFLRDHLNLKGAKYGCGIGLCGACTVHVNGRAVRSCQVEVSTLADAQVTTIEALAETVPGDGLHPLQQAWIEEKVPQCGYCQTGQIMNAAALLLENPKPSDDQIIEAMDGNLCRCGTYGRIRSAIKRAAGAT